MSRLTIYVIKEISSSFLFSVILMTGILWIGQSLRHLDLLTAENVSVSAYFSYIFLCVLFFYNYIIEYKKKFINFFVFIFVITTFISLILQIYRTLYDYEATMETLG